MKGSELIALIEAKGLEDFDFEFSVGLLPDGSDYGISAVTFKDLCVDDIGYSDKVVLLGHNDDLDGMELKVELK